MFIQYFVAQTFQQRVVEVRLDFFADDDGRGRLRAVVRPSGPRVGRLQIDDRRQFFRVVAVIKLEVDAQSAATDRHDEVEQTRRVQTPKQHLYKSERKKLKPQKKKCLLNFAPG